ncbi:hypothetical protein LWI28_024104 [Acer negundo]|uniref:Uncharacterized protein n=1 Tax=Acer negundo TaxID=4023 RepID=A0AAD5IAJ7_ACENE|nr:hypothetical protein LWI28_024104 [Acer negundo]
MGNWQALKLLPQVHLHFELSYWQCMWYAELETSTETTYFGQRLKDLFVLLCCEDSLLLYSLKSVIQGDSNPIQKVNLLKPCCWTTTFKKNEKECGLVVLYRTDLIEKETGEIKHFQTISIDLSSWHNNVGTMRVLEPILLSSCQRKTVPLMRSTPQQAAWEGVNTFPSPTQNMQMTKKLRMQELKDFLRKLDDELQDSHYEFLEEEV